MENSKWFLQLMLALGTWRKSFDIVITQIEINPYKHPANILRNLKKWKLKVKIKKIKPPEPDMKSLQKNAGVY